MWWRWTIQDPVARALSSYNMDQRRFCDAGRRGFSWNHVCPRGSFLRVVQDGTDEASRGGNCFFDGKVRRLSHLLNPAEGVATTAAHGQLHHTVLTLGDTVGETRKQQGVDGVALLVWFWLV